MKSLSIKKYQANALLFFFLTWFFLLPQIIHANEISVTATGIAINPKEALLAAKRSAVEKGIGTIISAETEVKNFMVKKDIIISKTIGSVKEVNVIKEDNTPDGLVKLKIQAIVSSESIKKDLHALGILMESMDKPRIMVVVSEFVENKRTHICEKSLIERFKNKKFNMVDPATIVSIMEKDRAFITKVISGDKATAVQIGTNNGAEVIIIGNVTISCEKSLYDMYSGQADVSMQAILCSNGNIVSSRKSHAAAVHISKKTAMVNAIKQATNKIIEDTQKGKLVTSLLDDIIGTWQDMQNNGMPINITVKNVTSFKIAKEVKMYFEHIDGNMVDVIQRGWNKSNVKLDVLYKGRTEVLAEKIDGNTIFDSKRIFVSNFSSGSLTVDLK
jgi:hypothetical protein